MPELTEWRVFCAVARLQSIVKAAEQLGISPPSATKHIAKLESRVGEQLIDRTKRPLRLTPAGERYESLAVPLVNGFDNITRQAQELLGESALTITSPPGFLSYMLPSVLRRFRDTFPQVQVRVFSRTKTQAMHMLREGESDVAMLDPVVPSEFAYQQLYSYRRVLITSCDHPLADQDEVAVRDIAPYPLALLRAGTTTRTVLEGEFRRDNEPFAIALELDDMATIKRFVIEGIGVSVVPEFIVEPEDAGRLAVVRLRGPVAREDVGAVTLRERPLSSSASNFIAALRSSLGRTPGVVHGRGAGMPARTAIPFHPSGS